MNKKKGGQLDNQNATKWTEAKALKLAHDLIKWQTIESSLNIFYEEFLIIEQDLYPGVISHLCEKYNSFSKLIEKSKKIQEIKLKSLGVADQLNASMTKFILINNHEYTSEKVDHTSKGEKINNINVMPPASTQEEGEEES